MEEEKNNCQITCVNFYLANTCLIDIDAQIQMLVLSSLVGSVDVVGKEGSDKPGWESVLLHNHSYIRLIENPAIQHSDEIQQENR